MFLLSLDLQQLLLGKWKHAVHSSDDSTCNGFELQMLKVSHKHWACLR